MGVTVATETIKVAFPDGNSKEFPKGTTVLEVARSLGPRLAKDALVGKIDSGLVELGRPLERDTPLRILTAKNPEALEVYRHSSAHLLAAAVLELFPGTRLGIGPPTENGFFYDFYREESFSPEDLEKIEKKMQELVKLNLPYDRVLFPREEGLKRFAEMGEQMKCELIQEKAEPVFSCFTLGPRFIDFCRGPHVPSTRYIKAFKLLSVAGAYWKGDEHNQPMQRIYGTSFFSQKDLDRHLHQLEEAKKRDHRKLGRELDLFRMREEAGSGLIFWHPKGAMVRKVMEDWLRDEYLRRGYSLVYTPHVAKLDLWKTSGHAQWFGQNMFPVMKLEDAEYQLKPMNCPFHILIYKDKLHSYRELPVRMGELGTVYRYERSGVMHGLLRVRGFTQDDAHIFCTPQQVEEEILGCVEFALHVLRTFGFQEFKVELSTWDEQDSEKYGGTPDQWKLAETSLARALEKLQVPAHTISGEAAFYGPKIDVKLVDAIGRLWQLSTVQFDFTLPERFDLSYVGEDGQRHRPVMVHRALWGSVERFFGVLIEHYAGAFPVWLAPLQVLVLPISERHQKQGLEVVSWLREEGIRAEADLRNEKVNLKIREAQLQKVPYMLVLGDQETQNGTLSVRIRKQGNQGAFSREEFLARIRLAIASRQAEG